MYQRVGYYDYERREDSNCCCLLFLVGLLSVACFVVAINVTSDVNNFPILSFDADVEISLAFNKFMTDYGRSYANDNELQFRKEIFAKSYKEVKRLNEESTSATFEINQFADLTDEEFEAEYVDAKGMNEKCTVAQLKVWQNPQSPVAPDPKIEVNWVEKGKVSPVKNQGSCGSCWTFATMSILETIYAIRENRLLQFAEQQIVDCCRKQVSQECPISNGCRGGLVSEGFQYAINKGVMLEAHYPYKGRDETCKYDSSKIVYKPASFVDITPSDVKEMEKIIQTRSVAIGLAASASAFRYYKSGVLEKDCPENPLNHGVAIVGAGTENGIPYWYVRNSWGKSWGAQGYIKISRSLDKYPTGVCGIASCPEYVKYKE